MANLPEILELVHADAMDVLRDLPDASADLIFADLPYGMVKQRWDERLPMKALWTEYRRILAPRGNVVATAAHAFTHDLAAAAPDLLKLEMIWHKSQLSQFVHARNRPLVAHENVLVFSRCKIKDHTLGDPATRMKYNPIGSRDVKIAHHPARKSRNMGDITGNRIGKAHVRRADYRDTIMYHPNDYRPFHSTQKPESLMEQIVGMFSDPGDIVLDCTMGSGTTGVAAVRCNRSFFGIERDTGFFAHAASRIMAEVESRTPSRLAKLWGVDEVAGLMTPMIYRTVEDYTNDDAELVEAAE